MSEILQTSIPYDPFAPERLPGIQPLPLAEWLAFDEAFAAQMAERARLVERARKRVIYLSDGARPAALELLDHVLQARYGGARDGQVTRPDGVEVAIDRDDVMGTLSRLVQQDLCLLERPEGAAEHVLTGAVLCFPASWTLAQKAGKPLLAIHKPVRAYDAGLAARVQRLFDGVQVGRPLWRFNALWYADATLHQPRVEEDPRPTSTPETQRYLRSELQSLYRLPDSRAVVFGIHTRVLARRDVLAQWGREEASQ